VFAFACAHFEAQIALVSDSAVHGVCVRPIGVACRDRQIVAEVMAATYATTPPWIRFAKCGHAFA
jgi:hypothetical protein